MLGRRIQIDAVFRARFLARRANALACAANAVSGASLVAATAMPCVAASVDATRGALYEWAIALANAQAELTQLFRGAGVAAGATMAGIRLGIDACLVARDKLAVARFGIASSGALPRCAGRGASA
jgi:hypothetical protein